MISKKFKRETEFRDPTGVVAIVAKIGSTRARMSDRRAGVPPGAYSKRTHMHALGDPPVSAHSRGNRGRGRRRGSRARRPTRWRRAGVSANA